MFSIQRCGCGKFASRGRRLCPICYRKESSKRLYCFEGVEAAVQPLSKKPNLDSGPANVSIAGSRESSCGGRTLSTAAETASSNDSIQKSPLIAAEPLCSNDSMCSGNSLCDNDWDSLALSAGEDGNVDCLSSEDSDAETDTSGSESSEVGHPYLLRSRMREVETQRFVSDELFEDTTVFSGSAEEPMDDHCFNCHRTRASRCDDVGEYKVTLSLHPVDDITFKIEYLRTFEVEACQRVDGMVTLCCECRQLLSKEHRSGTSSKYPWHNVWPVYIWELLTDGDILRIHGVRILECIPAQWLQFWLPELQRLFPATYLPGSYEYYKRIVRRITVDVTERKRLVDGMKKRLKLGEMKTVCDKHMTPLVLCPWGCSTYFHSAGSYSYDAVIARYFPGFKLAGRFSTDSQRQKIEGSRSDFFTSSTDCLVFAPNWSVHPSVYYKERRGPVIMTCMDHKKGDGYQYFHLPKTFSCLPSRQAESLAAAVFRTRTLKTSMPKAYSNEYRLQEMLASYCGIDTAYVSQKRYFDYKSHIEDITEARSFAYRDDIKGLAARLCGNCEMSCEYLENLKRRSHLLFPESQNREVLGASYASLVDCINLQRSIRASGVLQIQSSECGGPEAMRSFIPNWPSTFFRVHSCDSYGCKIKFACQFRVTKTWKKKNPGRDPELSAMWFLCNLVISLLELWEMLHKNIAREGDWRGFLLSFLSRTVLKNSTRSTNRRNPFYAATKSSMLTDIGLWDYICRACGADSWHWKEIGDLFGLERANGELLSLRLSTDVSPAACFQRHHRRIVGQKVIVVVRHDSICSLQSVDDTVAILEGFEYELRYIAVHKRGLIENHWYGEVWARHGGSLKGWWVQRSDRKIVVQEAHPPCVDFPNIALLVYVRVDSVEIDNLRRDYLKFIGGQNDFFCQKHRVPLVTSLITRRRDKAKLCCYIFTTNGIKHRCTGTEDIECPIVDCNACVCKTCRAEHENSRAVMYVADIDSVRSLPRPRGQYEQELSRNENDDDCNYGCETHEQERTEEEPIDFSALHSGFDQPIFDIEHCREDENRDYVELDEERFEGLIPTSHESKGEARFDANLGTMGTSVLLNKFGTVLVRRDNRLQASRRERNLVERVVSVKDIGSVPLVYMEGMLFPSIFWSQQKTAVGGLLGAIPTPLFCQHGTRKRYGIASLASHARLRLKGAGSLAATSPNYLSFLFDSLANGALEGQDTRVVLSRGFEDSMGAAGMRVKNKEDDLYTDTIDNRQMCHNLCAAQKYVPATLFITLTCNQAEHFGMRHIKRYLDSSECVENYKRAFRRKFPSAEDLTPVEEKEVRLAMHEAAKGLLVRNWMEVRRLLIDYITKSDESPVSEVDAFFARDEYQGEAGNLSHIHMMVTLKEAYNTKTGRQNIQELIRGFISGIVGVDEVETYIEEGILEGWDDYWAMRDHARKILPHSCSSHRCLRRVGPGSNEVRCRVPDTRKLSGDITTFFERKIDIEHSADALEIFERLGFCKPFAETGGRFCPTSAFLDSKRILAPARMNEGNITPVVGKLFAATRSSMNVQICTSFGTCRYLVKYLTKIDENNYVVFTAKRGNQDTYTVEKVNLHNTKITSSAKSEAVKLSKSRHNDRPRGRAMAQTEMMQIILGYPQILTNIDFIRVPTLALGDRPGMERRAPAERYQEEQQRRIEQGKQKLPDMFSYLLPHVKLRRETLLDPIRWHTASQEVLLEDQLWSKVSLDQVTVFGARPPELLCIDRMEWYFRFFERSEVNEIDEINFGSFLDDELDQSLWVDGLGCIVRLRSRAIPELAAVLSSDVFVKGVVARNLQPVMRLLQDICSYYSAVGTQCARRIFNDNSQTLRTRSQELVWESYQALFLVDGSHNGLLPVPVMSNVRPHIGTKFVVHLLLSMGHFDTEADLWSSSSMPSAFIKARLISAETPSAITEADCDHLLRRWIKEQVQFYPITSRILDSHVCSAQSILRAVLLRNEIPINELPPYYYTKLHAERTSQEVAYLKEIKVSVVEATLSALTSTYAANPGILPTHTDLINARPGRPVLWNPRLPISPGQSAESFSEQRRVQMSAEAQIQKYMSASTTATKNFAIVGPPGAGKTHCMQHSVIYALCQGLVVMTTAMLAERAYLLGGQHFHRLFKLQVRDKARVHRLAELAVIALQKMPHLLVLLRALDVLFVDELGQLSAEMLSVIDIVLRRVRNSSLFMGGILVIGTLDQVQLRPIKELPFLLSPYVLTTFLMGRLRHYVRCASCEVLKKLNGIARFFTCDLALRELKLARFAQLVRDYCTFVSDWSDPVVTEQVLRVFPKRKQAMDATDAFLKNKRRIVTSRKGKYYTCAAKDIMVAMESHGEWSEATPAVVAHLNRSSSEPQRLDFFKGAIYHFTYNKPGHFSATQLAVLLDMPDRADIKDLNPIRVMAAPPGTKTADVDSLTRNHLFEAGWREVLIGQAPEYTTTLWQQGVKAKRQQYGLKHHIASTVHCAIGHTMTKIATELSQKVGLWERAMVVVLISRVREAKDIIFVGNKEQNIATLTEGLRIRSQYDDYMNHVVDVLSGLTEVLPRQPLSLSRHPFRPRDITLPSDSSGVVYMLVSEKSRDSFYIGMTQNLPLRLNQHNGGYGAQQSCSPKLRPWALYAYVAGFAGDRTLMLKFERSWKVKLASHGPKSPAVAVGLGQSLIDDYYREDQLVMVVST